MSVYDERYEVHYGHYSYYTSDPAKALRCLDKDPENGWCNEGYGEWRDVLPYDGVSEVIRRTLGPVSRETLAYRAQRNIVQEMLERMMA